MSQPALNNEALTKAIEYAIAATLRRFDGLPELSGDQREIIASHARAEYYEKALDARLNKVVEVLS